MTLGSLSMPVAVNFRRRAPVSLVAESHQKSRTVTPFGTSQINGHYPPAHPTMQSSPIEAVSQFCKKDRPISSRCRGAAKKCRLHGPLKAGRRAEVAHLIGRYVGPQNRSLSGAMGSSNIV